VTIMPTFLLDPVTAFLGIIDSGGSKKKPQRST